MEIVKITAENFETEVLKSEKPVLVDFYADWCGPCKMLGPVLEQISAETDDFVIAKLNVDDNQALAQKYGVMTIPTLIVFKNGEIANTSVGVKPKQDIIALVK